MTRATHIPRWVPFCLLVATIVFMSFSFDVSIAPASNPGEAVGLQYMYTYRECAGSKIADPINVVWVGGSPIPAKVGNVLAHHGWNHNDYKSPMLKVAGVDHQYVHETDGHCYRDGAQRATHSPAENRDHVRLFETSNNGTFYVVGDAHHDQNEPFWTGCHQAIIGGHITSSFNRGREALVSAWPSPVLWMDWGNTFEIEQCNGDLKHSDGWVAFLEATIAGMASYAPENTEEPTITGTPAVGNTLTAHPGTWTGNPTSFNYEWCRVELETDSCVPYPGATGPTWTVTSGSAGNLVGVMVTPTGADESDGALSQIVEIPPPPPVPAITLDPATELTTTQANLNDTVNPNGSDTHYYFQYGTTASYGNTIPAYPGMDIGSGTSGIYCWNTIENLKPDTMYHFHIVAYNSGGTTEGPDQTFTTPSPPVIKDAGGEPEYGGNARLWGSIDPKGYETTYHFELGTTTSYGSSIPVPDAEDPSTLPGGEIHEQQASGLKGNTTYHMRLVATNRWGTTYGADEAFTTPPWKPWVNAEPASSVYGGSATFKAYVNPEGFDTHYQFEWGTTSAYGNRVPVPEADLGSGHEAVPISQTISGIANGTTYHFRLVATNAEGTTTSPDQTFMVHQWEREGVPVSGATEFTSSTPTGAPLVLRELPSGLEISCSLKTSGTLLAGGQGEITSITSPSGEAQVPCLLIQGGNTGCTSAHLVAQGLPWGTEISTIEGEPRYRFVRSAKGGSPTWGITCGNGLHEECENQASSGLKNNPTGAELLFESGGSAIRAGSCTNGQSLFIDGIENLPRFTAGLSPKAETEAATSVISTGATLNGAVVPEGARTEYHFEYGTTTAYGSRVPATDGIVGSTVSRAQVSEGISHLSQGTTYHYRLVATNNTGTAYGPDQTFRTKIEANYLRSFGSFGGAAGQLREPSDLAVDPTSGNVWVADHHNNRLEEFNPEGAFVLMIGGEVDKTTKANLCTAASHDTCGAGMEGTGNSQFNSLSGLAVSSKGNVWASDAANNQLQEFSPQGAFIRAVGQRGSGNGQFYVPDGLVVDGSGNVYVADRGNDRVEELSETGAWIRNISKPEEKSGPFGVTLDSAGNLWVSYAWEGKIAEFSPEGKLTRTWGQEGSAPGQLHSAYGLRFGPEGNLWASEYGNSRVQVFTPAGEYLYGFGSQGSGPGQFTFARGIAFSPDGRTIYALDSADWTWEKGDRVEEFRK